MLFPSAIFLFVFLPVVLALYYNPFQKTVKSSIGFIFCIGAALVCSVLHLPVYVLFAVTAVFAIFFFVILKDDALIFKNVSDHAVRNFILLMGSLFFYAWGEPIYVFLLVFSIVINYLFGLAAGAKARTLTGRFVVAAAVLANTAIFFVFKYMFFVFSNCNNFFGTHLPLYEIALPLGISFYTFQALSYVIDVYRGNEKVEKNPLSVGLYIALFPQLVAGPIVRYGTIAKELTSRKENLSDFSSGMVRFTIGLGKKMILANPCAAVADMAFNSPSNELTVLLAWMGAIAYTFQIYFDFSGYSDMAIGLGRMFGFHFPENFNFPYIANSITDFWRRWHISLSSWFRDYVYFPLGGSRVDTKTRLVFNLFVVWMLTGIWHGANWTFILWGAFYFVLIAGEKLLNAGKDGKWWGYLYTMPCVILAWVFFRAVDITSAIAYCKSMVGSSGAGLYDEFAVFHLKDYAPFLIMAAIGSFPVSSLLKSMKERVDALRNASGFFSFIGTVLDTMYVIFLVAVFLLSVSYVVKSTNNPFIYFNF